jgi:hypothetical protein
MQIFVEILTLVIHSNEYLKELTKEKYIKRAVKQLYNNAYGTTICGISDKETIVVNFITEYYESLQNNLIISNFVKINKNTKFNLLYCDNYYYTLDILSYLKKFNKQSEGKSK